MSSAAASKIVVAVGSKNPVKVRAARLAMETCWPGSDIEVHGFSAPSDVPDQPVGDDETRQGAVNRSEVALKMAEAEGLTPNFSIGLEGGVVRENFSSNLRLLQKSSPATTSAASTRMGDGSQAISCFAWMALMHVESEAISCSRTGSFVLPSPVVDLLAQGMELGHADDAVFGRVNSKHGGGSVGLLTRGLIDRTQYYVHALQLAAAPFLWPEQYGVKSEPGRIGEGGEEDAEAADGASSASKAAAGASAPPASEGSAPKGPSRNAVITAASGSVPGTEPTGGPGS